VETWWPTDEAPATCWGLLDRSPLPPPQQPEIRKINPRQTKKLNFFIAFSPYG
jgi:hypothetical protein